MLEWFVWASETKLALREGECHPYIESFLALYSNKKSNITSCYVALNKGTIWQLKSSSNVNTHAPRITWTLMFFFSSLCLSRPLNAVSPMCAHCSLDSLAGSNTGTQLSCLLCCITHCLPVPVCVLFPVHQTIVDNKLLCQQREQCVFFM